MRSVNVYSHKKNGISGCHNPFFTIDEQQALESRLPRLQTQSQEEKLGNNSSSNCSSKISNRNF